MNIFNYIKERVTITDVVSEYATLRKAGLYLKGRCPFHHEKTASFSVSPHKDIFYCFGCHVGGDVISFIAKVENCSQFEAVKFLADRYHIDIPADMLTQAQGSGETSEQKNHYFMVHQLIATWCTQQLVRKKEVMQYLNARGINQHSIDYFTIGYFPGGPTAIKQLLSYANQRNVLLDDLMQTHILAQGKRMVFSSFEERIIFPIKDQMGRFCGFGGRIFNATDQRPKYYNSRESDYFIKGSLLFGLDLAKKSIQQTGNLFLVEGYTDCIAMAQHGYANTVATLGTAGTAQHLKILSRYANQLYVLYDGDNAGQQAILRLTQLCWQASIELKVISLPPGQDPASFLENKQALDPYIAHAQDIFLYFIEKMGTGFAQLTLHDKVQQTRKFIEIVQTVDDKLKQDMLLHKAAKTFDIPFDTLKTEARGHVRSVSQERQLPKETMQTSVSADGGPQNSLEKKIFSAIINDVKLLKIFDHHDMGFMPSPLRDLLHKLRTTTHSPESLFDFTRFFDDLTVSEKSYVSKLLLENDQPIDTLIFEQLVLQLHKKRWKVIVHEVKVRLTQAKQEGNNEKVQNILRDFLELKQRMIPEAGSSTTDVILKESKG